MRPSRRRPAQDCKQRRVLAREVIGIGDRHEHVPMIQRGRALEIDRLHDLDCVVRAVEGNRRRGGIELPVAARRDVVTKSLRLVECPLEVTAEKKVILPDSAIFKA